MRKHAYITALALGLLVLALLGWTADGIRWAISGSPLRRPATA